MTKKSPFNIDEEDKALFHLIKKRDRDAFTEVYNKYHSYLYALSIQFLKNVELAEEVVQHVFVKFWETTKDINVQISLKNYLFTMTKNHIINTIRDKKNVISLSYENHQIETYDSGEDILSMLNDKQLTELLYRGINQLPPQKKEICLKKLSGNKSNQEIAEEMKLSVNTVKSHYQEAVKMLRSYFRDEKLPISKK